MIADILNTPFTPLISTIAVALFFGLIWLFNKLLGDAVLRMFQNGFRLITRHDDLMDWSLQKIIQNVHNELTSLRIDFDSDRAYVLQFHNGEEYSSRMPRWRLTNTFDVYRRGVHSSSKNWSDVPATLVWSDYLELFFTEKIERELPIGITLHSKKLSCMNEDGVSECPFPRRILFFNVEELELGYLRAKLEQEGVSLMIQTPIVSSDNRIVGILGVDYTLSEYESIINDSEFDICQLCAIASQIALIWEQDATLKNRILKIYRKVIKKSNKR
jgi:hypothetical protein